ncbi:MAG: hypothetical protein GY913_11045 [Proteobacteria bacterium]|nr:hypothetical protein [Pseudomonadota bacterium]
MEAAEVTIAHLPLGEVVCAWGAETVRDVMPRLSGVICHLVVRGGAGDRARVFRSSQVLRADPDLMLDMLPGGSDGLVVAATTKAHHLPVHRPLVVQEDDDITGILIADVAPPVRATPRKGSVDARELAMATMRDAMKTYRKEAIPIVLDIRDGRVEGDGQTLSDVLQILLNTALESARKRQELSCVHVFLSQGDSGLWLVVEDRSGRLDEEAQRALVAGTPSQHKTVLTYRALKERVEGDQGSMTCQPSPWGVRFIVCLKAPERLQGFRSS